MYGSMGMGHDLAASSSAAPFSFGQATQAGPYGYPGGGPRMRRHPTCGGAGGRVSVCWVMMMMVMMVMMMMMMTV
jgi:hypothetical protein